MDALLQRAAAVPPAQLCQGFFVGASVGILGINILPDSLRKSLMDYGARRPDNGEGSSEGGKRPGAVASSVAWIMDHAQVPHAWFLHFYILTVAWSLFWGWQYIAQGAVMRKVASAQAASGAPSVEMSQVLVAWFLFTIHGLRRLYESFFVAKLGSTPMSIIHWALGLVYYTAMGVSIWVEGSGAILESWEKQSISLHVPPRMPIAVGIFAVGFLKQHECHVYLASLKKYTLPSAGWFQYIICPHYTSECLIYLGLALGTAPPRMFINRTVLCGLAFVAVNLGATAYGTKQWYAQKFGAEKVATRWRMIPLVF